MSDIPDTGVLYTEYSKVAAMNCHTASLWSYETSLRGSGQAAVARNPDGSQEYWLTRSDPLLNTILPGTGITLIVNLGDIWTAGERLPRVSVVGPVTQARALRTGRSVRAVGAGFPSTAAPRLFGVPASVLVDRIVALQDLWGAERVEQLFESLSGLDNRRGAFAVNDELAARINQPGAADPVSKDAAQLIRLHAGRVSIDQMARSHGVTRQQFARRFCAAAGLPPKLFARITRFQALTHTLLSNDVSRWAMVSGDAGFYDQAHMINEFRAFTGSSPTAFFLPHDSGVAVPKIQLRGRPSEWLRQ